MIGLWERCEVRSRWNWLGGWLW